MAGCDGEVTAPEDYLGQFAASIGLENARAVLAVRDAVNRVSIPELGA